MSEYFTALCDTMEDIARNPRAVFMGQSVAWPGTAMFKTMAGVPMEQRIEFPVAEDMQMGAAIGMSLAGDLPVCIFPRWNFLLCATNQLVLHLDKLPLYSRGGFKPKVIIRTAVATDDPLDPGPQHIGDFCDPFRMMLATVHIHRLQTPRDVRERYAQALAADHSTILVEMAEHYT
jgi:pyruvate/2-oxoglutarate/acetoin dehydrogenase E1 component